MGHLGSESESDMENEPKAVKKKVWWRRGLWQLRRLVILYLVVVLILSLVQEWLIFPSTYMQNRVAIADLHPAEPTEVINLKTADGQTTAAYFTPAQTEKNTLVAHPEFCPTIIYSYGNGNSLATSEWFGQTFSRLGVNVIVPEYLGVGAGSGKVSEEGCYATMEAAYQWALRDRRINKQKIIAMGYSMGGAMACDLAYKHQHQNGAGEGVVGLVLCSSYTSLDEQSREKFWMFPTSWILKFHFRTIDKIPSLKIPILLMHGTQDEVVPYRMSLVLRDAAKQSVHVEHVAIKDVGHNDLFNAGEVEIIENLKNFLKMQIP